MDRTLGMEGDSWEDSWEEGEGEGFDSMNVENNWAMSVLV